MTIEEITQSLRAMKSVIGVNQLIINEAIKALEQEPTINNDLGVYKGKLALLELVENTYADFCSCEGGEGWLKIDGKEYSTDAGYALEGMGIFMEVFKRRLAESEGQMTRAEKFYEVFGIKMDTTSDCGFFDCTNRPHCDGCPVRDTEAWWNGEYKENNDGNNTGND